LAESELEVLYRTAPVGMCVLDTELRFVRVNEAFAELHRRTVDGVLGMRIADITHPAIRDEARRVAEAVLATGDPVTGLELNAPRAEDEGDERWWGVDCRALERDGRISGIAVVVQDITVRKLSEESAARRLEELESVYRRAPVGLAHFDRDLRYVRVNERLAEMNGLSVREHLGRRFHDVNPQAARMLKPLMEQIVESGVPMSHIETTARPVTDSVPHAYVLDFEPVKDQGGAVRGIVAVIHDVTRLKAVQRDARARLEELESLYRNAPVGLCLIDTNLCFVRANERVARFTGLLSHAHAGRPFEEVVPPEGQFLVQAVARVLETGRPARDLEVRGAGSRPAGEWRSIRVDLEPATGEGGDVTGVIAVVHDVTELRRAEEEARESGALAAAKLAELEAVYSAAPVGLALVDAGLRFARVNERWAALHGLAVHEHIGRPVGERLGSVGAALQQALESVLVTGSPVRGQRVDAAGARWRFDHHPVKAADGSVSVIVVCVQEFPGA
jgi:PAS domain S-box-containing protein